MFYNVYTLLNVLWGFLHFILWVTADIPEQAISKNSPI